MAGVLILEYNDNNQWKILSQSYFHYVPEDHSFILDNVESNETNVNKYNINLDATYAYLAQEIKNKYNIKYFLAGKDYSKIQVNEFKSYTMDEDPRFFDEDILDDEVKDFIQISMKKIVYIYYLLNLIHLI